MIFVRQGPFWFRIAAVLLLIWGGIGCFSWIQQMRLGADAMGTATAYDRSLYAGLPGWYNPVFGVSVLTGLIGAILLFMRRATARPFLIASLVTIVIQFGWLFVATDIVAHKGAVATMTFPLVIAAIAVLAIWLAGHAHRKSWTL